MRLAMEAVSFILLAFSLWVTQRLRRAYVTWLENQVLAAKLEQLRAVVREASPEDVMNRLFVAMEQHEAGADNAPCQFCGEKHPPLFSKATETSEATPPGSVTS